ncbi:hypothetical protein B0I31_10968 [Saccharothrix carnea]|uniref:Uncharacterized protein n=1 Tax=Saccharothrix carnea TaxID=1280637 RepID=A0A2P8I489_SACCR|nr:hypothetical protein [Saccharothrix carnea]PSL53278.1 hypothetical protein B0I31_10968 [Saccharothrix carnea]
MRIARFNSSWYWPWRGRCAVWWGVIVVVVFVLGFAAGYGEAVLGALATAVATAAVTEIVKAGRRNGPGNA